MYHYGSDKSCLINVDNVDKVEYKTSQDCETTLRATRVNKGHQVSTRKCQLGQFKVSKVSPKSSRSVKGLKGHSKVSKVSQWFARSFQGQQGHSKVSKVILRSARSFQGQQGQSKDSKVTQGQARLVQGKQGQ